MVEHIDLCPHHTAWLISRAKMIGLAIGVVLGSGVSSGTVVAVVMRMFP